MTVKRIFLPLFLSLLFVPALASVASAQTADDIIEKHLTAVGGRAALGKVTTRRSTGTMTITTPGGDLTGPLEIDLKAPNKARVSIQLDMTPLGSPDKMNIEQKFDGTGGVMLNSMQGDTQITGEQLDNMRNNLFPTSLLSYKAAGFTMEVLPKEQVNGKSVLVLRAKPKAGSVTKLYFDPDTYMLVRSAASINMGEMGQVEQVSDFSDYRAVDGIKIAFQVVSTNADQSRTIKLTKVEHNVVLADSLFSAK